MAQTSIGKAALVLTADGKGAKAGMAQFKAEATKWADGTQKQLRAQFQGGFFGGLLGGSLTGLVQESLKDLQDWADGVAEIRAQAAATQKHLTGIGKAFEHADKRTAEWNATLTRPSEKLAAVGAEMEGIQARLDTLTADRRALLARGLGDFEDSGPGGAADRAKALGEGLKKFDELILAQRGKLAALDEARGRLLDPATDPALGGAVAKATRALEDQADTWGLTGDAAARAMFKAEGATDAMLAKFDAAGERLRGLAQFNGPLAFGPLAELLGRGATALIPQNPPPWLGFALSVADKVGDLAGKAKEFGFDQLDNPALRRGSSAEVSARARHELGQSQRDQLAEARQQNRNLKTLTDVAKAIPTQIAAALALAPL